MSNYLEYEDITAIHPGYYVAEMIESMGISQVEFADRVSTTAKTISQLVNGQINLSNDLAMKLSLMTGMSVETWLKLQMVFDQKKIEIETEKQIISQKNILSQIDYDYFVENVGLPKTRDYKEKIKCLCNYLKVSSLEVFKKEDFLISYRTNVAVVEEKNTINSAIWFQTAMNMAEDIETKPFSMEKLKKAIPELRSMTIQKPEEFWPRMKEIFTECGIVFIVLPHLKNSGISGAVKWINGERVLLAMNDRGLYADKFWFTLFHEIKHVMQKRIKTVFVNSNCVNRVDVKEFEIEADEFARNVLIDPIAYSEWNPNKFTSDAEIVAFANRIGIHPGIVAGRLQHDAVILPNRCSHLKEKYIIQ